MLARTKVVNTRNIWKTNDAIRKVDEFKQLLFAFIQSAFDTVDHKNSSKVLKTQYNYQIFFTWDVPKTFIEKTIS